MRFERHNIVFEAHAKYCALRAAKNVNSSLDTGVHNRLQIVFCYAESVEVKKETNIPLCFSTSDFLLSFLSKNNSGIDK